MEHSVKKTSAKFHGNGMAFYHTDGLVPAYKNVTAFTGSKGRFATLPDIINARIATAGKPGLSPWCRYFTTATAEYVGETAGGNRIIIVAHGIGPMSTLDGVMQAYSYHFKDRTRNRVGGRISREEFLKLESGHYGDVSIVDLAELLRRDEESKNHLLHGRVRASVAATEPLVAARLGARFAEYIKAHTAMAHLYLKQEEETTGPRPFQNDPRILALRLPCNGVSYRYSELDDGAIAHLLSIGQLEACSDEDEDRRHRFTSLYSDVSTHGWHDGTRLAAVRDGNPLTGIHPGFDRYDAILEKHWAEFTKPVAQTPVLGITSLTDVGERWFTQHPKKGEVMDTGEPEFLVTKMEPVAGGPGHFTVEEDFFFRYGVKDIERIAPLGANAYALSGFGRGGDGLMASIEFFRVEVDTSRRLPRKSEILSDVDTLTRVLEKDEKAA